MYRDCVRFAMFLNLWKSCTSPDADANQRTESIIQAYASYQALAGEATEENGSGANEVCTLCSEAPRLHASHPAMTKRPIETRYWLLSPAKGQERSAISAQIKVFDLLFPQEPALTWWCLIRFREQQRRVAITRSGKAIESFDIAYRVRLVLHLVDIAEQEASASTKALMRRAKESTSSASVAMKHSSQMQGFSALLGAMLRLTHPSQPAEPFLSGNQDDDWEDRSSSAGASREHAEVSVCLHGDREPFSVRSLFEQDTGVSDPSLQRSRAIQALESYTRCLMDAAFAEHLSPLHCTLFWDRIFAAGPDLMAHLAFQLLVQICLLQLGRSALDSAVVGPGLGRGEGTPMEWLKHPSSFLKTNDIEAICRRASNAADYLLGYDPHELSAWDPIYGFDIQWPILRRGDTGPRVRILQYLLRAHGYGRWFGVDGVYGIRTCAAVARFQQDLVRQPISAEDSQAPAKKGTVPIESTEWSRAAPATRLGRWPSSPTSARSKGHTLLPSTSETASSAGAYLPSAEVATGATSDAERYLGDQVDEQLWFKLVVPVSAGDRGDAVMALQVALLEMHGYDYVRVDGFFGRRTEAAVREFQRRGAARLMPIDGLVGPVTWLHLIGR
jgi:peptidoglycan hydrolase-like protein with peptidoglycan-binding domain